MNRYWSLKDARYYTFVRKFHDIIFRSKTTNSRVKWQVGDKKILLKCQFRQLAINGNLKIKPLTPTPYAVINEDIRETDGRIKSDDAPR